MTGFENDMLDIACYAPALADREKARRALEKYYGGGEVVTTSPRSRHQQFERQEWYEEYRPDGSLARRGGSVTRGSSFETF